jgi:hypothetical protein
LAAALRPPPPTSRQARQQRTPPGPASSATRQNTGQNTALHLDGARTLSTMWPEWTLEDNCSSLSLQGRSVSHSHSQQSEGLTDLLGLVAEDQCGPRTLAPFKINSEEPRVAVQVAGGPQTPTWLLPDFSGKLYLSQISMVGVDSLLHQPKKKKRQFYL